MKRRDPRIMDAERLLKMSGFEMPSKQILALQEEDIRADEREAWSFFMRSALKIKRAVQAGL